MKKLIQSVILIENIHLYLKDSQHVSALPQRTKKKRWQGVGGASDQEFMIKDTRVLELCSDKQEELLRF